MPIWMVAAGERLSKDAIKEAAFLRQRPWLRCSGRGNPILHTIIVSTTRGIVLQTLDRPLDRLPLYVALGLWIVA